MVQEAEKVAEEDKNVKAYGKQGGRDDDEKGDGGAGEISDELRVVKPSDAMSAGR
eukprot:CAMPEP_0204158796 /NCGR_PEP_ID=MMETSP0361-20130328/32420_1 /ASSEMBLY_ACC=CAM_ASM_000343 /TAXON_ID=268821 /ORGANISM="Scrippsiella Hangoei, Strain SHTV-5" /LENGTH=54 /DNA_ID=CAMNT_0051114791 /DNA_START=202 /DNA_END=364 /DNA_ORIENTATION=+